MMFTLGCALFATSCQKEDNIRPIFDKPIQENDNTLVGTLWTYRCDSVLPESTVAYTMLSRIDFSEIDKGDFFFSTDLMGINTDCEMQYTLHDGQGTILLSDAAGRRATVAFALLDEEHLKVTLTPAVALADSANLAIIINGNGGTWEAVYSRWNTGTGGSMLDGSIWTADAKMGDHIEAAEGHYCELHLVARLEFAKGGLGTMVSYCNGNWGETNFASNDTLRRPFMVRDDGQEVRLLFADMGEAVLHRAVVNHDTVLMLTPTVEALGLNGDAATLLNILAARSTLQIRFNRPSDLADDRGYGRLVMTSDSTGLYLLERSKGSSQHCAYYIRGEKGYSVLIICERDLEAGTYTIDERFNQVSVNNDNRFIWLQTGSINITNITGGYRIDITGEGYDTWADTPQTEAVSIYYQGPLNDYNTVE